MPAHCIRLSEAKEQLTELVNFVCKGDEVTISCENGALVKLVMTEPSKRKHLFGLYEGQVKVSDDFDDELTDSFWLGDDKP